MVCEVQRGDEAIAETDGEAMIVRDAHGRNFTEGEVYLGGDGGAHGDRLAAFPASIKTWNGIGELAFGAKLPVGFKLFAMQECPFDNLGALHSRQGAEVKRAVEQTGAVELRVANVKVRWIMVLEIHLDLHVAEA